MKLEQYKKQLNTPVKNRTLCFFIKNGRILLGLKKRDFGKGKYLGIGGKVDDGETIEQAAIREVKEEVGIVPHNIRKIGILDFYFPYKEDWNQQVHVFIAEDYDGNIKETEEMKPEWFAIDEVPYSSMWEDAIYYIPLLLKNQNFRLEFTFDKDQKVFDSNVILPKPI